MKVEIKYEEIERPIKSFDLIASGGARVVVHLVPFEGRIGVEFITKSQHATFSKDDFNEYVQLLNKINDQLQKGD
jgi:hypothetical protein